MSDPALDPAIIQELQSVMGDEFRTLVDSFERDSRQRMQKLDEAIASQQADEIRRTAHSFKGSSGNLGAMELSRLCLELEQAGYAEDLRRAPELLEQIRTAFERARRELDSAA